MIYKSNEEITQIIHETSIYGNSDIVYDCPYEHPRVLGFIDMKADDDFAGGLNNLRSRKILDSYIDKLRQCGREYRNNYRLAELLEGEQLGGGASTKKIVFILGGLLVAIPVFFILGIGFLSSGSMFLVFLIFALVWALIGVIAICSAVKKVKESEVLNNELIDSANRGEYTAFEFTVSERKYYHKSSGSETGTSSTYYYVFTQEGMNFMVDTADKYASADVGSRLIVYLCTVNSKQTITILFE